MSGEKIGRGPLEAAPESSSDLRLKGASLGNEQKSASGGSSPRSSYQYIIGQR